jgi:hypothetical protein
MRPLWLGLALTLAGCASAAVPPAPVPVCPPPPPSALCSHPVALAAVKWYAAHLAGAVNKRVLIDLTDAADAECGK